MRKLKLEFLASTQGGTGDIFTCMSIAAVGVIAWENQDHVQYILSQIAYNAYECDF